MLKKLLVFFVSLSVGIGLLVLAVRFIGWQEISSAFFIFAGWQGLIIFLLTLLMLFLGLWKWQVILKSQGYNLSFLKLTGPYLAGFSLTYLFPMITFGGEIFKGYILREKFSVPWKNGITSIFIDKILEFTSFLITIFAGIIFFLLEIGPLPKKLGIALGVFLFIVSFLIGFFYLKIFKKESIVKVLAKLLNRRKFLNVELLEAESEVFSFFKYHKKALFQASFLAFLRVIVTWLRCWLLVIFLGKSIGFLSALSILGFYYFVYLIPIPAALGSHEIIQTFSFSALGLGTGAAPAFTMIQRGAELILALVGLIIFIPLGLGLLQIILFKRLETLVNNKD